MKKIQVFGQTASYARKTQKELQKKVFKFQLLSGIFLLGAVVLGFRLHQIGLGAVLGLGFLVTYAMSAPLRKQIGQKRVGVESENLTVKTLKGSDALAIYNDLSLGYGGDLDHCVVYANKVIVIETKTGFGEVRVKGDTVYSGQRAIPKNPIKQVLIQKDQLQKVIGVKAVPIICVSRMANKPFLHQGVWITSARDLNRVIAGIPNFIDSKVARQSMEILNAIVRK